MVTEVFVQMIAHVLHPSTFYLALIRRVEIIGSIRKEKENNFKKKKTQNLLAIQIRWRGVTTRLAEILIMSLLSI